MIFTSQFSKNSRFNFFKNPSYKHKTKSSTHKIFCFLILDNPVSSYHVDGIDIFSKSFRKIYIAIKIIIIFSWKHFYMFFKYYIMTCKSFSIIHFFMKNSRKILFCCPPDWVCPLKVMGHAGHVINSVPDYRFFFLHSKF